ncbi:hypothetical protein GGP41_006718 [Bipolaris sorokiniana]|uniref:Cell wall mannoprotein PIR1-like C-terminal domain-containing protein n=2 Tax=Cochliobolus sativus TaxID=45130 RepID=A0A8H5ZRI8_COCSA|nr:uncharacterized protein COCSADRAFT_199686 [Bipolaris sorokiniana ND90Pr]EMD64293.1 hypothetical protein COCSADRAFT_199686 [Bipolaris sorokiniana ND90Pr]KAF5853896.1 hypothetical protein GGP41_006718 [Bipolaris sorokiniana]
MKSFIIAGLVAAATALPQASSGSECAASVDGTFTITTVKAPEAEKKRALARRQFDGTLKMTLKDGVLKDQSGRDGYIASNYQFQFDGPVQADALDVDGFGLCSNNSLSLKGSTLFYQCLSGDFYNLYSQSIGEQCLPINIMAVMVSDSDSDSNTKDPEVTQISDGQPQASEPAVTQISDGQPQASAPGSAPPPLPPVTQISDGQPQASAPGSAPPPPPPVTQISDGQPQASSPAPEPPAPIVTPEPEPEPETTPPAVTQISDGQPQITAPPSNHSATHTIPPLPDFTGAAATSSVAGLGALFGGVFAMFLAL